MLQDFRDRRRDAFADSRRVPSLASKGTRRWRSRRSSSSRRAISAPLRPGSRPMISSTKSAVFLHDWCMRTLRLYARGWVLTYGKAPNGKQKYLCHDCGRQSREAPDSNAYEPQRREEILRAYQERSSLRGLTRTLGVSRNIVSRWLKKS